jgi:hypothetical protein
VFTWVQCCPIAIDGGHTDADGETVNAADTPSSTAAFWGTAPPRPSSTLQIKGKKRHILVDIIGLLLHAVVHPADIQDRDGGILVLSSMFGLYPFLSKLFADAGYQGPRFRRAVAEASGGSRRDSGECREYAGGESPT